MTSYVFLQALYTEQAIDIQLKKRSDVGSFNRVVQCKVQPQNVRIQTNIKEKKRQEIHCSLSAALLCTKDSQGK